MRIAVYPGGFDPVTNGHLDLVTRMSYLFDRVIVAVIRGRDKGSLFTLEERIELLRKAVETMPTVEVEGFKPGVPKRHGCPSHGIGLTPDETQLWVCDAANQRLHVFDATVMPPKQIASIPVRDDPGWITFSLDGKFAYPSTGEVIDVATRKIVATLKDETGAIAESEKIVEIQFASGKPVRAGDQFGIGRIVN